MLLAPIPLLLFLPLSDPGLLRSTGPPGPSVSPEPCRLPGFSRVTEPRGLRGPRGPRRLLGLDILDLQLLEL